MSKANAIKNVNKLGPLEKAAMEGDGFAANILALFYSQGQMERHNCEEAVRYYQLATDAGVAGAADALARCGACMQRQLLGCFDCTFAA